MAATLMTLLFAVLLPGGPAAQSDGTSKASAIAPSLPALSEQEENRLDGVINRFIDYDSGKLRGPEGRQAVTEFNKLGPEAIPALIRGLNRAAEIEYSCPAVTIAKKLSRMFRASRDVQLLQFARENIGAGIAHNRHQGVIRQLRLECMLRQRAVLQSGDTENPQEAQPSDTGLSPGAERELRARRSVRELVELAGKEQGPQLKEVLSELGRHRGDKVMDALGAVAARHDGDVRQQARDLLRHILSELTRARLKEKLKDEQAEVRTAAAHVVADRRLHWESDLIAMLSDGEAVVRQAAHEALVRLAPGHDFGPKPDAGAAERKEAQQKWRAWLAGQGER